MADLLTFRPCPLCGSVDHEEFLKYPQFHFISDEDLPNHIPIRQVMCIRCHMMFMNPTYTKAGLKQLFAYYDASYGHSDRRIDERMSWLTELGFDTPQSVCDIGCGSGDFLNRFNSNIRRIGIDVSAKALHAGHKKYPDIEFVHADPVDIGVDAELITLFHVLEHVPDPRLLLKHLSAHADRGTTLCIEVPILELGRTNDINGFFSMQHQSHFSRSTLLACVKSSGWDVIHESARADYNGFRLVAVPTESYGICITEPDPYDKRTRSDLLEAMIDEESWISGRAWKHDTRFPKVAYWGAGFHLQLLHQARDLFQNHSIIVVDSDPIKHGKYWNGHQILSPEVLLQPEFTDVPVIISSYGSQEEIHVAAVNMGIKPDNLTRLYDFVRAY